MSDTESGPNVPATKAQAGDGSTRGERIIRWAFWIGLTAVIVWVFADLVIKH